MVDLAYRLLGHIITSVYVGDVMVWLSDKDLKAINALTLEYWNRLANLARKQASIASIASKKAGRHSWPESRLA